MRVSVKVPHLLGHFTRLRIKGDECDKFDENSIYFSRAGTEKHVVKYHGWQCYARLDRQHCWERGRHDENRRLDERASTIDEWSQDRSISEIANYR
jgi:hypothetical protein